MYNTAKLDGFVLTIYDNLCRQNDIIQPIVTLPDIFVNIIPNIDYYIQEFI